MAWKAVRKFNGACDPHWSTPEGIEEWGGYATFDHTLGGGYFGDALDAARKFIKDSKGVAETLGKMSEYDNAMRELSDTNPRNFSFVFNQDIFEISGNPELYVTKGVSNSMIPITPFPISRSTS